MKKLRIFYFLNIDGMRDKVQSEIKIIQLVPIILADNLDNTQLELSKLIKYYSDILDLTSHLETKIQILEKLGNLYLNNGDILKSIEFFEKIFKLKPDYSEPKFLENYNFIKKACNY